jgi:lipid-binding SYLF domain-containing protein
MFSNESLTGGVKKAGCCCMLLGSVLLCMPCEAAAALRNAEGSPYIIGVSDRLCSDYAGDVSSQVREATEQVLKQILSLPEAEQRYLIDQRRDAVAFAIFPNVQRQGIMAAALYGKGILVYKDKKGIWSSPIPLTMKGQSVGPTFGAQSSNIIFTFNTVDGLKDFLRGHHHIQTSGSQTSIEHVGHHADPLGIKVHSFDRGVMMGQSLDSYSIDIDEGANAKVYGVSLKPGCIVEATRSGFKMPFMLEGIRNMQQKPGQPSKVMYLY